MLSHKLRMRELGNCMTCRKPKGDDGTQDFCRSCATRKHRESKESQNKTKEIAALGQEHFRKTFHSSFGGAVCKRCGLDEIDIIHGRPFPPKRNIPKSF